MCYYPEMTISHIWRVELEVELDETGHNHDCWTLKAFVEGGVLSLK